MHSALRLLVALILSGAFPYAALAATFTVTTTADAGAGSLRQALADARVAPSPPHTIIFGAAFPSAGVITLASPLPTWINGRLTIDGNSRLPRISGNNAHPIFVVGVGGTRLDLEGLALRDGRRNLGGCVALAVAGETATLAINNTALSGCRAIAPGVPRGGAIDWQAGSGGQLRASNSVFTDNRTVAPLAPPITGGGAGGAIAFTGSVLLIDSTRFESNLIDVSGAPSGGIGGAIDGNLLGGGIASLSRTVFRTNSATPLTDDAFGVGGAIAAKCDATPCTWTIERSYFRGNSARRGGAIWGPGSFGGLSGDKGLRVVNSNFVNNDALESGGALFVSSGRAEIEYSSFFGSSATSAAHLVLDGVPATARIIANVFAATAGGASACAGSVATAAVAAGSISRAMCNLGIGVPVAVVPTLPDPVIDESQAIGVLRFDGAADVIDAIPAAEVANCPADDSAGAARPIDGDGDGVARCDRGALEHPANIVFRNGFEP